MLTAQEVSKHNKEGDVWVILRGNAYDFSDFLSHHPGGKKAILNHAGKDGTEIFESLHSYKVLEHLPKEKHLGPVDMSTYITDKTEEISPEEQKRRQLVDEKPPLSMILNLHDFETLAKVTLKPDAWAYYSSGADDEITLRQNRAAYQRVYWKPRILRNVKNIDISTNILGIPSSAPFYITATALAKLGNPVGEINLTRAAARTGIPQMLSTLASCSYDEVADAATPDQTLYYQLYVNENLNLTKKICENVEARGFKAIFVTVDAPSLGRREKDMRMKFSGNFHLKAEDDKDMDVSQGASAAISSFIDPSLDWDKLEIVRTFTKLPMLIKGVQCTDDVLLAAERGYQGVVLSNHGGRQLDYAPAGIEVLAEAMPLLRAKGLDKHFEVFVDGGARRASDIMKALALGATAVGIGRPFLYAHSVYGEDGVAHAINILKNEMIMNMRLLGAPSIDALIPDLVDASSIKNRIIDITPDYLYSNNYEPSQGIRQFIHAKL